MTNELKHIGVARRSGRYPWGSSGWGTGERSESSGERSRSFLDYVNQLKKEGLSEVEIAKGMGMSTTQLRAQNSIAKAQIRVSNSAMVNRLTDKGYSNVAIGKRMGLNESSVRSLKNQALQEKASITSATADMLKESVAKKTYIDVGAGSENYIGISRTKLNTAISMLEDEGYKIWYVPVEQLGTGKKTTIKVLAGPDSTYKDVYKNQSNIKMVTDKAENGGRSYLGLRPIENVNSNRIEVRYGNEGGSDKDGVIELRRNVSDLNLGTAQYAQVRIGVDGDHYLKGMAMYSDDLPKGVDIRFNTNKISTGNKLDAMKLMKKDKDGNIDTDNPFGTTLKIEENPTGDNILAQRGALNIVNEEGDWGKWSKSLSSQMLSKQSPSLAKKQLDMVYASKKEELDEINSLTNPVVKKTLLDAFADDCDSSASHLKAAALPRQSSHVILPITSLKENEIYAPKYENGEQVILIRYPHGGTFEIPQLVVNNKNKEANSVMKQANDAVGIHPKTAQRLSGADFDGDTVLVIPNNKGIIKTSSPLKNLSDFDPQTSYPDTTGYMKKTKEANGGKWPAKQQQMGNISNLITDMTIKGAPPEEIARAVRHSMVIIDAEKHNLDYKQSALDNGIAALKSKYQGGSNKGAATLISKAESKVYVDERKEGSAIGPISSKTNRPKVLYVDPKTGEKLYTPTGKTYTDKKGNTQLKKTQSTKMKETKDAFTLSSGTPMETVYATYANQLKSLGNTARLNSLNVKPIPYSSSAKTAYAKEVASLNSKLNIALKNAPLERQAQLLANTTVSKKRASNPDMDASDLKKIKGQALAEARTRMGAKKTMIEITPKEWEALQNGAITTNKMMQIINNTDLDSLKQLATPRTAYVMTPAKTQRAKSMLAAGYTQSEIASALGVSATSIANLS